MVVIGSILMGLFGTEAAGAVRPAGHAGSWYPGGAGDLRRAVEAALDEAPPPPPGPAPLAVIAPHAGFSYSGKIAARAFALLRNRGVKRVFLLGPSHHEGFSGIALPGSDLDAYATPLGDLPIDREAVEALRGKAGFDGPPSSHLPEHSLELETIFLPVVAPFVKLVPLVVGRVGGDDEIRALAEALRPLLGEGDVVVVSSDFTHYGRGFGYVPFEAEIPKGLGRLADGALAVLVDPDLVGFTRYVTATGDTICGREPIRILLALLPGDAKGEDLGRDTSGRMTGDWSHSVTYQAMAFRSPGGWVGDGDSERLTEIEARLVVSIVRTTLERYLHDRHTPTEGELGVPTTGPLREKRAAFVTLRRGGMLRGCIGHIEPVQPLWKDLRDNAIAAAVHDPRFQKVTADELVDLDLDVSILTPPRLVDGPEGFEVGRHGVVLSVGDRRAVFLPQVAPEQGWDRETTLRHLSRKAGLPPDAWRRPDARFEVFEAQVVVEE